jgi:allophanate hydrolase subunit 1
MKRVWWVAKLAVLVAASYCIFVPGGPYTLRNVQAWGCDTSYNCARNSDNNCYCPVVSTGVDGCQGCFVPNNSPSCGKCSGGDGMAGI